MCGLMHLLLHEAPLISGKGDEGGDENDRGGRSWDWGGAGGGFEGVVGINAQCHFCE